MVKPQYQAYASSCLLCNVLWLLRQGATFTCVTAQVTQLLQEGVAQLARSHGDVGESVTMVEQLLSEHDKMAETAKVQAAALPPSLHSLLPPSLFFPPQKHYQYGCDLLATALRTRRSCQLDLRPNAALVSELHAVWEQLSQALAESKTRLVMALNIHTIADEVCEEKSPGMTELGGGVSVGPSRP